MKIKPGTISDRILMGSLMGIMWIATILILYSAIFMSNGFFDIFAQSILALGSLWVCHIISFGMGVFGYVFKNRPI